MTNKNWNKTKQKTNKKQRESVKSCQQKQKQKLKQDTLYKNKKVPELIISAAHSIWHKSPKPLLKSPQIDQKKEH